MSKPPTCSVRIGESVWSVHTMGHGGSECEFDWSQRYALGHESISLLTLGTFVPLSIDSTG